MFTTSLRENMTETSYYQEKPTARSGGQMQTGEPLPPANTKRWVIRRKAQVVSAVENGSISLEQACERYSLSVEEFLSWRRAIEEHGLRGLRATRVQQYRAIRPETSH
jgi:hypothetical protein